jgi:hypothetical protein
VTNERGGREYNQNRGVDADPVGYASRTRQAVASVGTGYAMRALQLRLAADREPIDHVDHP